MILRLSLALCLLAATACGDACQDLSEQICRCQPSFGERAQCMRQVGSRKGMMGKASAPQQAQCADLLPGCSCEALAEGRLSACGLTPP